MQYVYLLGRKNDNDLINLMSGKSWMVKDYSTDKLVFWFLFLPTHSISQRNIIHVTQVMMSEKENLEEI